MNVDKIDILCNQVIDVALLSKEAVYTIHNANLSYYPSKFVRRINSVVKYVYNLFMDSNNDKYDDTDVNDLMIHLMRVLVDYRNSYHRESYAYKVMNSLLDIVEQSFIEINS